MQNKIGLIFKANYSNKSPLSWALPPFLCAIFFSAFIYLEWLFSSLNALFCGILCTFFALFWAYFYLHLNRKQAALFGLLVGLLWFWWIGLSFRFYNLSYAVPLVALGASLVYALIFYVLNFFSNPLYKIAAIALLSEIWPFNFNWLVPEIIFIHSFFSADKIALCGLLASFALFNFAQKKYNTKIALIPLCAGISLLLAFNFSQNPQNPREFVVDENGKNGDFYLAQTHIPQDIRWSQIGAKAAMEANLNAIESAIKSGAKIVVLPETAFAFALNLEPKMLEFLSQKSENLAIITGAIRQNSDGTTFNSSFIFENKQYRTIDKIILVPFGEEIPLPRFLSRFIEKIFFENGTFEKSEQKSPQSVQIADLELVIAICYEGSRPEFFKSEIWQNSSNSDSMKNLVLISNNAWFSIFGKKSSQAALQRLLLEFFARKNNVKIWHSSNY